MNSTTSGRLNSASTVSPTHLLLTHGQRRLEEIVDECVGGIGRNSLTDAKLLDQGLELVGTLQEGMAHIGAEFQRRLQQCRDGYNGLRIVIAPRIWPGA